MNKFYVSVVGIQENTRLDKTLITNHLSAREDIILLFKTSKCIVPILYFKF